MAYINKKTVVHWVIDVPSAAGKKKKKHRRAKKGDPGAYPVKVETKCYYLYDNDRIVRKAYTDKAASDHLLNEYKTAKARGDSGLIDRLRSRRMSPSRVCWKSSLRYSPPSPAATRSTGARRSASCGRP